MTSPSLSRRTTPRHHPSHPEKGVPVGKQRVGIDLLVYHDLTDNVGADLTLGVDAGPEFGEAFTGYHIVAVGRGVNPGKDKTVVLAFGSKPMAEVQALLDKIPPS
jgi:hypothetical protein